MGLRGPGARPRKKADDGSDAVKKRRRKWRGKKLTRAERVIAFLEDLPITSGKLAGQKMKLRDWQREIVSALYATDADGVRTIRTAVISMPRKNGKTQIAAGLALCHLIGPESEPRGQVYSAAVDRQQASLIFNELVALIDADDEFAEMVNVQRFKKTIEVMEGPAKGTIYTALSSDARSAHGLSPSFVVCDEAGQWPRRDLFDALATSTGARAEPLMVIISTQASNDEHFLSGLIDHGLQVQSGVIEDPSFHLSLFRAPDDAEAFDPKVWQDCNPALGDFRSVEEFEATAKRAKAIPAAEAAFRQLYLNQRIEAEARWLSPVEWDACNRPVLPSQLEGRACYGGLDLGSTRDLTALVLVFPDDDGGFDALPFFWCPRDALAERAERDRVPYDAWAREGLIEATPGRSTDFGYIRQKLAEISARFHVQAIAYDRWRIEDLRRDFDADGITIRFSEWGQGFRDMAPAVDALESLILDCKLRHGGHRVLRWNAANAVLERDASGNRKLAKNRSREKIDGLVALAMAIGLARRDQGSEPDSPACLANGPIMLG